MKKRLITTWVGNKRINNIGMINNALRAFHQIRNKGNKFFYQCDTYSEWKEYFLQKYSNRKCENFYRYLLLKQRYAERKYEQLKTLVIPLELAVFILWFSIGKIIPYLEIVTLIVAGIFCSIFLRQMEKYSAECDFIADCIEILFKLKGK